jgi:hypothetical protein
MQKAGGDTPAFCIVMHRSRDSHTNGAGRKALGNSFLNQAKKSLLM